MKQLSSAASLILLAKHWSSLIRRRAALSDDVAFKNWTYEIARRTCPFAGRANTATQTIQSSAAPTRTVHCSRFLTHLTLSNQSGILWVFVVPGRRSWLDLR